MSRFAQEHPEDWSELIDQRTDADEALLISRLRIARLMASGPLSDEAGS